MCEVLPLVNSHEWSSLSSYFYREPEEIGKEVQTAVEKTVTKEECQGERDVPECTAAQPEVADGLQACSCPHPIKQFQDKAWSA